MSDFYLMSKQDSSSSPSSYFLSQRPHKSKFCMEPMDSEPDSVKEEREKIKGLRISSPTKSLKKFRSSAYDLS